LFGRNRIHMCAEVAQQINRVDSLKMLIFKCTLKTGQKSKFEVF
jgi:hypothetical protein